MTDLPPLASLSRCESQPETACGSSWDHSQSSHLPGEIEQGWAEGPCVQGAGDHLEVICMAGDVWAQPVYRVKENKSMMEEPPRDGG